MRYYIHGVVQGVGFRPTVYNIAKRLGLDGFVCNHGSNVEVYIAGGREEGEAFIGALRADPPPLAVLGEVVEAEDPKDAGKYAEGFTIVESKSGSRDSRLPADAATCAACLREMDDPEDRRHMFPFTNCTDCGARYTAITDLPYDRPFTSMEPFTRCPDCDREYREPGDRRFHAQTISCPACGPRYTFHGADGAPLQVDGKDDPIRQDDPIRLFAERIAAGEVGVFKGWGGMHIVSLLSTTGRLRELYRRPSKPFAVLFGDMEALRGYAVASPEEEATLSGRERPIVVLRKREGLVDGTAAELEAVAPGLGNVGCMLPYTAAQHSFFTHLAAVPGGADIPGVVFTSANLPGEPMLTDNASALKLGLDCYLLHDRKIAQRCDDSLLKVHRGRPLFIRRSRGFVPTPLPAGHDRTVLALGGERNASVTLTHRGTMYTSQYIGNTNHYDTMLFLEDAARHLMDLFGVSALDAVAADMHPQYPSRRLARSLAEEFSCPVLEVQHHHAHALSLALEDAVMAEGSVSGDARAVRERLEQPFTAITVDGAGYGPDGTVWGGEVLVSRPGGYERVASLEPLPLLTGDRAVREPPRLVYGLHRHLGLDCSLYSGEKAGIFDAALSRSPRTSSMGRVLDAVSCHLGAGTVRTYEGEPAIRLERFLEEGAPAMEVPVSIDKADGRRQVRTLPALRWLFGSQLADDTMADTAVSVVRPIAEALARAACDAAQERGLDRVGLTGGVAYSLPIAGWMEDVVTGRGLRFVWHGHIPAGDGGISPGQAVAAGWIEE
jgi:hydrogenase maturation protein HypF